MKAGKGDSIRPGDSVVVEYYWYRKSDKKILFSSKQFQAGTQSFIIGHGSMMPGFEEGMKMLKKNGYGYFIIPPVIGFPEKREGEDTAFYFIRIRKLFHDYTAMSPVIIDKTPKDSVQITVTDPNQKYFGDTLFSMMKLLEVPQTAGCGITPVNVAFKFEMTWFDQGTQRKTILVFVECPESYGKDYFMAGKSYMITCVPMLEDFRQGHNTMNHYSLEKLDSYYGLRIKKM